MNKVIIKRFADTIGSGGDEFEYIASISETLEVGKWIAAVGRDIIVGETAKEVFEKIRLKYPDDEPFIMHVPQMI